MWYDAPMRYGSFFVAAVAALWMLLLTGCAPPSAAPTPTPFAAGQVLSAGANGTSTYSAYVLVTDGRATLTSGLSFAAGVPAPIPGAVVVDIPAETLVPVDALLFARQGVRYGLVQVRGTFTPTAAGLTIDDPVLAALPIRELSVRQLTETPADGQAVRVAGGLLASERSARLAEQLSAGGVPTAQARVIRVAAPIADTALLGALTRPTGGSVSYGQVVIEGIWRDDVLVPMGIFPLQNQ